MDNPFKLIVDRLNSLEAKIDELNSQGKEEGEGLNRFLNKRETAAFLSVSVSTVDGLRRDGYLKPYRFGRSVRFRLSEVEELAERRRAS